MRRIILIKHPNIPQHEFINLVFVIQCEGEVKVQE